MTVAQGHPRLHPNQVACTGLLRGNRAKLSNCIRMVFPFFFLQAFGIVFTPTVSIDKVFCVLMGLLIETSAQINPGISEESGFPLESLIQMRRYGRQLSASHSTDQGK